MVKNICKKKRIMSKRVYSILILMLMVFAGFSQNVGINPTGTPPNANAGLDIDFPDKGLLIPRVSLTSTSSFAPLSAHVAGMIVYNTASINDVTPGFYYNNGSKWVSGFLAGSATGDMLYWNGTQWIMIPIGQPGQFLQISGSNIPTWGGTSSATITTNAAGLITATTAQSGGNITNDGGSAITFRGVCWNTTGAPTISGSKTTDGSGLGAFISNITSLLPATTYYVRAYAINNNSVTYGNEVSFVTLASLPTLAATTAASSITGTSANSGGNVISDGGSAITERGICYGTTSNPTISNSKVIDPSPGIGTFISNISGLLGGTTYYVRAYATNSVGTAYGTQISFATSITPPTLVTSAITNIGGSIATSGGTVTWNGGGFSNYQAYGIAYSTTPNAANPTKFATNTSNFSISTPLNPWVTNVTGLTANTTYYFRAYLDVYRTNPSGWITVYGNELSFTTSAPALPILATTTAINNITATTANSGGSITSDNGAAISAKGVCWSTSHTPVLGAGNFTSNGTGNASFVSSITGLVAGTTYYVRSYATNSVGTAYGPEQTFSTCSAAAYNIGDMVGGGVVFYVDCNGGGLIAATSDQSASVTWGCSGTLISAVGTGAANTAAILAGCATRPIAASVASSYNGGGFNDWYLPSASEFLLLANSGYLSGGAYWNSTSNSSTVAGYYYFNGSNWYNQGAVKTYTAQVRAIRSFGPPVLATVTTDAITNITGTSGISGGNITNDGGSTISARGVCWSTSTAPTISGSKTIDGSGTGVFVSNITGLTTGVTYYVRAYATNAAGTSYGNEVTFTPFGFSLPTLTTDTITNRTSTSGTSGGNITNDGGAAVTSRGVCWSLNPSPTIADSITTNGTGTGTFVSNINGLITGSTYYIRAYATNSVGTAYGNEIVYIPIGMPVVSTEAVYYDYTAFPASTTATSGGNVTSDGGSPLTASGVVWNTSPSPTIATNLGITNDNTNIGFYASTITGLITGTTYYIRAYATNSLGTSYGTEITLTPGVPSLPTITTGDILNKVGSMAEGGGNILNDGGDPITSSGLCWGLSADPTTTVNVGMTTELWTSGLFYSIITGLTLGTTYHVRAYATNSIGTAYGADITFTATAATIGQFISGGNLWGNVFYVDGTGSHGLIADPWGFGTSDWGCASTVSGASGTAVGTGPANTASILADILTNSCVSANGAYAAEISKWLGPDWYLPSKDEFDLLWINRVAAGLDGTLSTSFPFWCSSEFDSNNAWNFDGTTWLSAGLKSDMKTVWPIRSF